MAVVARTLNRALIPFGWKVVARDTLVKLGEAAKYDYYWHKAYKKIDVRTLAGFGPLADKAIAAHRTGMRHDRLYTLWQAVSALPDRNHAIVEVGTFRGGSARFIGEALRWHNRSNPFFVCDTFEGHTVVDQALDGPHRVGQQFVGTSVDEVKTYLADLANIVVIAGDFRHTSTALDAHAPFALVHVDVDVYPITSHSLRFFASRLIPHGLIVVDDYGFTTCRGAKQAVDEFVACHPEFRMFHLLTGQALLVRLA
jgi:hypothetical protein